VTESVSDVPGKSLLHVLTKLAEAQIVKRGFQTPCPHCSTPSWYPLEELREQLTCPGCSNSFVLPVEYPPGSGTEISWEYTLNTLFNRVMDQDVLPVVLALHHLTAETPAFSIVPGMEIWPSGQSSAEGEFDFVFVREQCLFGGECKAGTELGEKDIRTALLAARLGFHEFHFCTVQRFSNDAKKLTEELASRLSEEELEMSVKMLEGDDLLGEAVS
ncbi:MAG: hypothetical protein ABIP48_02280, partial [Planctomycetota bacterium]